MITCNKKWNCSWLSQKLQNKAYAKVSQPYKEMMGSKWLHCFFYPIYFQIYMTNCCFKNKNRENECRISWCVRGYARHLRKDSATWGQKSGIVIQAFNSSTLDAKSDRPLWGLRPAWYTSKLLTCLSYMIKTCLKQMTKQKYEALTM